MEFVLLLSISLLSVCWAVPLPKPVLLSSGRLDPLLYRNEVNFARNSIVELQNFKPTVYGEQGNANEYVERFIVKLKEFLVTNGYDPLSVKSEGDVKWMNVAGLSSVYRSGDATLNHAGTAIVLELNVGFAEIKATAYIEKQLWWVFWLMGTVHVTANNIKLYGRVRVELANSNIKPSLEDLSVTDWGSTSATMEGANWIGTMASWFPSLVTSQLKKLMPPIVRDAISKLLQTIDIGFITNSKMELTPNMETVQRQFRRVHLD